MRGKTLAWSIVAALIAAVIGWLGGAKARDLVAGRYDVAVGPVTAGVVVVTPPPTAAPTPAPTIAPTPKASATVTPPPTATPTPVVTLPPTFPPTTAPAISP